MNIKKEYEKFFERKKNDLCVHDAEDVIAFAKHYQALQLQQTGVSGGSEQLVCDMCGSSKLEECGSNEYSCEECGHFPITN